MHTICLLCMAALCFSILMCHPIQPKEDTMQRDIPTDKQKGQYTEIKLSSLMFKLGNGKMKAIYQYSKGAISLRKRSQDCSSVLDIKSNLFMCLDSNKQTHISGNKHAANLHLRHIRSQHVDPSDPLGSENPRSRTTNYRRQNQEHQRKHSGNVSKETIASCDDPLHVLLSKSPVSPNLQKEKKDKQVAPSELF